MGYERNLKIVLSRLKPVQRVTKNIPGMKTISTEKNILQNWELLITIVIVLSAKINVPKFINRNRKIRSDSGALNILPASEDILISFGKGWLILDTGIILKILMSFLTAGKNRKKYLE